MARRVFDKGGSKITIMRDDDDFMSKFLALDGWREVTTPASEGDELTVNDRLALKSYRATEAAFYERYRAAGLPEGGYLIDTINVFAELAKLRERVRELEQSMGDVLSNLGHETCEHEHTIRGGAIWTICEDCGRKWADDRGGFQPYVAPEWLVKATSLLAKEQPQ